MPQRGTRAAGQILATGAEAALKRRWHHHAPPLAAASRGMKERNWFYTVVKPT
jgi:hypothetical protein